MPTYVTLARFTDQGINNVKEVLAPERTQQLRVAIAQAGGRVVGTYLTQGAYDVVAIMEFPDEEAATAFLLGLGMRGNVRTETLRAFTAEEMQRILQRVP